MFNNGFSKFQLQFQIPQTGSYADSNKKVST